MTIIYPRLLFFFSSPFFVFDALRENFTQHILINDIITTGLETILGFLLGNIVGISFGLSLWYSKRTANLARPYIIAVGAIPIFSIAPMMIIWFGTGLYAKIMMAAISTLIVAITQAYEGAKNVDPQQIKLLTSFEATKNQIFTKIIIPSSLVWVLNSLKLNISFALLGAFIGEYISSDSGLGYRILKAGGTYDTALVLASLFCIISLAQVLYFTLYFAERTLWKNKPINPF